MMYMYALPFRHRLANKRAAIAKCWNLLSTVALPAKHVLIFTAAYPDESRYARVWFRKHAELSVITIMNVYVNKPIVRERQNEII